MSDLTESRESFCARMEKEGLRVVIPADDELLIDIDTPEQAATFDRMFPILRRDYKAERIRRTPSRSGLPREHIVVRLPGVTLDPVTRIALQASLGSDPMREFLSVGRVRRGELPATILIERPELEPIGDLLDGLT